MSRDPNITFREGVVDGVEDVEGGGVVMCFVGEFGFDAGTVAGLR